MVSLGPQCWWQVPTRVHKDIKAEIHKCSSKTWFSLFSQVCQTLYPNSSAGGAGTVAAVPGRSWELQGRHWRVEADATDKTQKRPYEVERNGNNPVSPSFWSYNLPLVPSILEFSSKQVGPGVRECRCRVPPQWSRGKGMEHIGEHRGGWPAGCLSQRNVPFRANTIVRLCKEDTQAGEEKHWIMALEQTTRYFIHLSGQSKSTKVPERFLKM